MSPVKCNAVSDLPWNTRISLHERQKSRSVPSRLPALDHGQLAPRREAEGPGGYDGVESLGGGRFLISVQDDSSISILENGTLTKAIAGIDSPGDIGWDPARRRVFVPLLGANQVMIWTIP